jgi:hypothetical protein
MVFIVEPAGSAQEAFPSGSPVNTFKFSLFL